MGKGLNLKKIDPDEFEKLLDYFDNKIGYKYTNLHAAFVDCRKNNPEAIDVLNELYKTEPGREYLKSFYRAKQKESPIITKYEKIIKENALG